MVNYYTEFELDRSLGLPELQRKLARVESLWKQRRTKGNPAAANKKLVLIEEARAAFATEASRADYDRRLDAGDRPEDNNPNEQFESWWAAAQRYQDAGQSDLAVAAIERALSSFGAQSADASFYALASKAYLDTGDLGSAVRYINEAILLREDSIWYPLEKAIILDRIALAERQQGRLDEARQREVQIREILLQATTLAQEDSERGTALGMLAFSLYFHEPIDAVAAERYARDAIELGDQWENAQRVLDDIAEERKKLAEQELRRRQQAARLAKERAEREIRLKKAEEERRRSEEERQRRIDEARKKAEAIKRKKSFYRAMAWLGWLIFFATVCYDMWQLYNLRVTNYQAFPEASGARLILSMAWLRIFDTAANNGEGLTSAVVCTIVAIFSAFLLSSIAIMQKEYYTTSEIWQAFGIVFGIYIAVIWVSSRIGKAMSKGVK